MVYQFQDHSLSIEGNIILLFVDSCEKQKEFGLSERSNSMWLRVTRDVLVNCTWTAKHYRAVEFNRDFINKCIYSPMLLSTR